MQNLVKNKNELLLMRYTELIRITPCGNNAIRFQSFPDCRVIEENYTLVPQPADAEIEEFENAAAERSEITVDQIVDRLNRIASNPREKTSDRLRADELLGKYLGMFTEKVQMSGSLNTGTDKLANILAQLKE
jgi:hypothetical protein